jgi:hypothetical protein
VSMLVQRIALLAKRLGVPTPRVAGQTRLGLAGTIRVTETIPMTCSQRVAERISDLHPDLDFESAVEEFNRVDVWTWFQTKGEDDRFKAVEYGEPPSDTLIQCSEGTLTHNEFCVVLASHRIAFACQPSYDRMTLRAFSVFVPKRPPPTALLLVAKLEADSEGVFDVDGFCTMVAAQARARATVAPRTALEREAREDREFITGVRRFLEALRNHAAESAPRANYVLIERSPVQLRTPDEAAWPLAFARPGTQLCVPRERGHDRMLSVLEVSDNGDVLTLDGSDDRSELLSSAELTVKPSDDGFKRMREALDVIAMGTDEAHGRLLEALTRPEALQPLPPAGAAESDEQTLRQREAKALALNTPDIALIHGPPGTGKTTVICSIVEELVKRGQRVLLVAPTHVALDNVLEGVGARPGVTAIRLGAQENVEEQAKRFLLQNRSKDLTRHLARALDAAAQDAPADDPVAAVQREWASHITKDDEIGALLLLNANLVCATPIGIAMAREFRQVEVLFDVMILDEASKATLTDFLVPAARARKWILVGDDRQLPPYVDLGELEAVVSERVKRVHEGEPVEGWVGELSTRLRQHFDNRMHPDPARLERAWRDLLAELARPFEIDDAARAELEGLGTDPATWRDAQRTASRTSGTSTDKATVLRLGAELLELQTLALPSVFERLRRLPKDRAVRLNYQHRMMPALAQFSSELVYDGDYPSAPDTGLLGQKIPGLEEASIWIDTAYAPALDRYERPRDTGWSGGAYTNRLEIELAVELVEHCATWAVQSWRGDPRPRGRGPNAPFEIGVTSFYLKQALLLRDAIFRKLESGPDPWRRRWKKAAANGAPIDIHVSIVDRFQGREKDLVILCTTRSNPAGRRGHVDNLNRLNVAVTRARGKRIIIGDSTTLAGQEGGRRRAPDDLLVRLFETSEQKKKWGRTSGGGA